MTDEEWTRAMDHVFRPLWPPGAEPAPVAEAAAADAYASIRPDVAEAARWFVQNQPLPQEKPSPAAEPRPLPEYRERLKNDDDEWSEPQEKPGFPEEEPAYTLGDEIGSYGTPSSAGRCPTPQEGKAALESLVGDVLRKMQQAEAVADPSPAAEPRPLPEYRERCKRKRGRPTVMTAPRRECLVELLRLGLTRREAARRLGVCPATITKLAQRDQAFGRQMASAEVEGANFKRVLVNAFLPGRVMIMPYEVLSTAYFEKEKEYLIARGLPASYVKRLRQCSVAEWAARLEREKQVEKAIDRLEKEAEKPVVRRPKVRRETKIVRRQFFNKSGQPTEVVRYVVEEKDVSDREALRAARKLSRKIERAAVP